MVKYIVFEITGKCNLRCKYCYNSKYNPTQITSEELSTSNIKKILNEAKKMGFELAAFSGGEPFLRKDLMDLVENSPIPVSILTNGEILTNRHIDKLKTFKHFKELRFSLDGFKSHDIVRKNSHYQTVIDRIIYALSLNLNVSVNTMITKDSISELPNLYELIKEKFSDIMWRLDVPIMAGRCVEMSKEVVLDDQDLFPELKKLIENYLKDKPKFRLIISNIFKSNLSKTGFYEHSLSEHPCDYALGSLTVRPNGDVSFCPSLGITFGNLKTSSIDEIMKNKQYLDFINMKIKDVAECKNCKYLLICGTGCRADAYHLTGNLKGKDSSACSHFKNFEEHIVPILPEGIKKQFGNLMK
ncbi:MAG: radical SAM protein [Nanoarchaeota archaeon]|nr:radical SAM protein [Nanoarchaeota archaeon]